MRYAKQGIEAIFVVLAAACADAHTTEVNPPRGAGDARGSGGVSDTLPADAQAESGARDSSSLEDSSGSTGSGATTGSGGSGGAPNSAGTAGFVDGSSGGTAGEAQRDAASADSAEVEDARPMPLGTPAIVAVGYAGLRVTSYDFGRTWINKRTLSDVAADDPNNLRGVTYAAGLFVAVGHKIFTSADGDTWEQREHPNSQWLGDVEYGNGRFVATGGYGYSVWSVDGIAWNPGGSLGTEASRSLAFGDGEFRTQTDPGNWHRSTDGEMWTLHSSGHDDGIAFCGETFKDATDCGPAFGHGVYVRSGGWNSGNIDWSEDGQNWTSVTVEYVGGVNAFAFGSAR